MRRLWLHGAHHGWAMLLSFAAFGQSLDAWPTRRHDAPRATCTATRERSACRALLGEVNGDRRAAWTSGATGRHDPRRAAPRSVPRLAAEPWLERYPVAVRATASCPPKGGGLLTDGDGALPLTTAATTDDLATLLAATTGQAPVVVVEWTPQGVVPVAVHATTRSIDIGPRGGFTGRAAARRASLPRGRRSTRRAIDLDFYRHDLFSAALLGTRSPPAARPTPLTSPIAELLVELPPPDAAAGLLDQIAAAAVLRRAGAAPVGAAALLAAAPCRRPRPEIPGRGRRPPRSRPRRLASCWSPSGCAPSSPVAGDSAPTPRCCCCAATAPTGTCVRWWRPRRAARRLARRARAEPGGRSAHGVSRPILRRTWPVCRPSWWRSRRPTAPRSAPLQGRLRFQRVSAADRAPLVAYLVHLPPGTLAAVADALREVHGDAATTMLAAYLADLATTRNQMLHELTGPGSTEPTERKDAAKSEWDPADQAIYNLGCAMATAAGRSTS